MSRDMLHSCSSQSRSLRGYSLAIVLLVVVITPGSYCIANGVSPEKNVLILDSFTLHDAADSLEPVKSSIRSHVSVPVNFHVEYLESLRFGDAGYENGVAQTLRAYRSEKLDLVVVHYYPALRFAIDRRQEIFPGVPIIFMGVSAVRIQGQNLGPGITGVTANSDIRGTLELALRLHPDTKNVAVVAGTSNFEQYWLGKTEEELRRHADKLKEINLVGASTSELLERVPALPAHTIVMFQAVPPGSSQPVIGIYDLLEAIARRFPTYCLSNFCFGHGGVGGSYIDNAEHEAMAGEMAARILSGERAENIPVAQGPPEHPYVDWRQLRRWHISEAALPSGTIVLYREPSVWDLYWRYIVAASVVIIVQALLIIGLLWQRRRKRKAELALRENEERLRVMADAAPSLIWTSDKDGNLTFQGEKRLDFTSNSMGAALGEKWKRYIHPDDLPSVLAANARAYEQRCGFSKEYRLRRHDGVYRWMFDVAVPRRSANEAFSGFIGSAIDITDQKLAKEALEKVSGKLIEAQEQERSRIARDLHDDICQRLALLSLEMDRASTDSDSSNSRRNKRMLDIRQHCAEIASDVQALSHELHSSKLDYLGLVAAVRGFCAEFSKLKNVNVTFSEEKVPHSLPKQVSLCLFRVTQEALHNALKHSGTSQFTVTLRGTSGQLQLEVRDWGAGFDMEAAARNGGLGLVSMQERMHLVKGSFHIESRLNEGTRIVVSVPVFVDTDESQPASATEHPFDVTQVR